MIDERKQAEVIRTLLLEWELYKKAHWYKSDAIDVEAFLMDEFARIKASLKVAEAIKVCNELINKQREYIDAQDKQIKLVTGDLPTIDMEGFGYHALAISQNLTKIEREMNELFEYWKQNIRK